MYKIIGYYICELGNVPDWLRIRSNAMLSVSNCLATLHPDLTGCFWDKNDSERLHKEYANKLNWKAGQAEAIRSEICNLLEKKLAVDGRFLCLEDARHFYQTYFSETNSMIVSVSTTEAFYDILRSEFVENSATNKVDFMTGEEDEGELLGYDILGWDISGFHSFLCNHLQKELPDARFNEFTLLENDFNEVAEFARQIQGKGEPVEWIPCRIAKCQI